MPAEPYEEFLCQADLAQRLVQSNRLYVGFALLLLTAELLVLTGSMGLALIIILKPCRGGHAKDLGCDPVLWLVEAAKGSCPLCQGTTGRLSDDELGLCHWDQSHDHTAACPAGCCSQGWHWDENSKDTTWQNWKVARFLIKEEKKLFKVAVIV